jgi:hypothetical protein
MKKIKSILLLLVVIVFFATTFFVSCKRTPIDFSERVENEAKIESIGLQASKLLQTEGTEVK